MKFLSFGLIASNHSKRVGFVLLNLLPSQQLYLCSILVLLE